MLMRDYENLKDITIPPEQEAIMDIVCEAWAECRASDCMNCPDRPKNFMSVMECFSLKFSRKLMEVGFAPVVHGEWKLEWDAEKDPKKYFIRIVCSNCGLKTGGKSNFCPKCGAKMNGGKANE